MQPIARSGAQQIPLAVARIDGRQFRAVERAPLLVKVPPGYAVLRRDDRRIGTEQGRHLVGDGCRGMRLQGDDDKVLRAGLGGVVGTGHLGDALLAVDEKLQTVRLHRRQMRPARDAGDVGSIAARQFYRHVTADRAGA